MDYRTSTDGTATVDGGRDYFKRDVHPGTTELRLSIIREQIVVNDTLFFPVRDG